MKPWKMIKQAFKEVTSHPDFALIKAINDKDFDGVKTAFARGANVNYEYNSLPLTETFLYTPIELAIAVGAHPEITREILSHKPDLSLPRYSGTVGDDILTLHTGNNGKKLPYAYENFEAILESGLAEPKRYHLPNALAQAMWDQRADVIDFFATHSDATRKTLIESGEHYASIAHDPHIAAVLRAKVAECAKATSPSATGNAKAPPPQAQP